VIVIWFSMKNIFYNVGSSRRGFSLAEVLSALTIGAMVLVAVLSIYSRANRTADSIGRKLDSSRLQSEVLQLIAEDIDKIVTSSLGTKVTIENKFDKGYPSARLKIQRSIYNSQNEEQTFEEIVWQSNYDYESQANGLILYRSHSGLVLEDKLLDEQRQDWEREYSFVPICKGVTFFKVQVPRGEDFLDNWSEDSLPEGIVVTISFAEPFKTVAGSLDVPDTEKIARTIAVDRTRKINFMLVKQEDKEGQKDEEEQAVEEDEIDKEQESVEEQSDEQGKPRERK